MKLSVNQKLKFFYGVAFEERLLNGDLVYTQNKDYIFYDLNYCGGNSLKGKYPLKLSLKNLIKKMCDITDIDLIEDKYDGQWDDAGSFTLGFKNQNRVKVIEVIECYDRNKLKTENEKLVFGVLEKLRDLTNEIYEMNVLKK